MELHIDNAEISLNGYQSSSSNVDFQSTPVIADDLAFIMENTAIHENENKIAKIPDIKVLASSSSSSSSEDSDSDSDVQIVEIKVKMPKKVGETICISDDSSAENDKKETNEEHNKNKNKEQESKGKRRKMKKTDKKENQVISCLLKQLTIKVDKICKGENVDNDNDNSSSSSSEEEMESNGKVKTEKKLALASIINDEEKVSDVVPKVRNEVLPEELPEDEDVITLKDDDNILLLGVVKSVVETMIVIEADASSPALDAESAFFLDQHTFLGKVFDTFGPVKTPYYSVRLSKRLDKSRVERGTKVYFVPFNQDITKYVFVEQLKKLKGSDASWKDDCEPPPEHVDYSDDEEEQRVRREMKNKRIQQRNSNNGVDTNNNSTNTAQIGKKRPLKPRVYKNYGNALLEHAEVTNNINQPKKNTAKQQQLSNQNSAPLRNDHSVRSPHLNKPNQTGNSSNDQQPSNRQSRPSQDSYRFRYQVPLDSYYAPSEPTNSSTQYVGNNLAQQGKDQQNVVTNQHNQQVHGNRFQQNKYNPNNHEQNVSKSSNPYLKSFAEISQPRPPQPSFNSQNQFAANRPARPQAPYTGANTNVNAPRGQNEVSKDQMVPIQMQWDDNRYDQAYAQGPPPPPVSQQQPLRPQRTNQAPPHHTNQLNASNNQYENNHNPQQPTPQRYPLQKRPPPENYLPQNGGPPRPPAPRPPVPLQNRPPQPNRQQCNGYPLQRNYQPTQPPTRGEFPPRNGPAPQNNMNQSDYHQYPNAPAPPIQQGFQKHQPQRNNWSQQNTQQSQQNPPYPTYNQQKIPDQYNNQPSEHGQNNGNQNGPNQNQFPYQNNQPAFNGQQSHGYQNQQYTQQTPYNNNTSQQQYINPNQGYSNPNKGYNNNNTSQQYNNMPAASSQYDHGPQQSWQPQPYDNQQARPLPNNGPSVPNQRPPFSQAQHVRGNYN